MGDKFLELFIEKTFYNELFNKLKSDTVNNYV